MRYPCIAIDPPWRFATWSPIPQANRSILNHYQTMSLDEIKALPVMDFAAKDCALFLWVIDTHLPQAFDVIEAWKFKYATVAFNWVKTTKAGKPRMSGGWWSRAGSETCLLATRGHPKPLAHDVRRVVLSPRREHSRKPDEIYDTAIPRLVGGPYLEMFARTRRPGWDVAFSDEADKFQ